MSTITVLYTCHACGVTKQPVECRAREEHEDLIEWMNKVRWRVAKDHTRRSLLCEESKCDLMIPAPADSRWVGEKDGPLPGGPADAR